MKKKLFSVLLGLIAVGAFADEIKITDYFPVKVGTYWTYANSEGKITNSIMMKNSAPDKNDGTNLYLFEQQMIDLGTISTLYSVKNNKVVILVTKNILGHYSENDEPHPVLAPAGQEWRYNDQGDDLLYATSKTSCKFDGKIYSDCILVEEKVVSGDVVLHTQKSYYAKGVGLIYVTLRGGDEEESVYMKLVGSSLL